MSNSTPQVSGLTRFLWFCAGMNKQVLLSCPESEHIKAVGIGATVLFTGMLAALSGGYALYTAFGSAAAAIPFGLFWGLVIFNLDRFMVSTIKKDQSFGKQLVQAVPRLALAVLLALVISKPLEIRIFESEIAAVLQDQKVAKLAAVEQQYETRLQDQEAAISRLEAATEAKLQLRESNYQDYKCECDGTCGTGKRGRGSECERKEAKYLQAQREYEAAKASNDEQIALIRTEIAELKATRTETVADTESVFSYGLVAKLAASEQLPPGPRMLIPLLIFLIEISPILAKLLSPIGPYELGLRRAEEAYALSQKGQLDDQRRAANKQQQLQESIDQAEIEEAVAQKRKAIKALSNAQLELMQDQINEWVEKEKRKKK